MFASSCASSWIRLTASLASCSFMSGPPVMFTSTPRAPLIESSSSSGFEMAAWAALSARPSPVARPVPISAMPISLMIVRTSAKSRLMMPCTVIRSEIPCTAFSSTSSAIRNASIMVVSCPAICSSRSFGIVISVSTTSCRASMPCSAWRLRTPPSKRKGLVTTATVSAPSSLATSATIGAPPVPVPPPSPAVTNTMSAPASTSRNRSREFSAELRPTLGSAPAPRPRSPRWIFAAARFSDSACASVLVATKSTPDSPARIIVLTAFPPPPPTPTTLIRARRSVACSNSIISSPHEPDGLTVTRFRENRSTRRADFQRISP